MIGFQRDESVVFINDRFYWVVYDSGDLPGPDNPPCVMFFDLKRETFGRILFLESLVGQTSIAPFGKSSICAIERIRSNLTNVWEMEQPSYSWIRLVAAVSIGKRSRSKLEAQQVLGFRNND